MDSAQIELLVRRVVDGQILNNWQYYVVLFFVVVVGGAVVSFAAPYLKTRGKAYATKTDFDELLAQLQKTTETAESIRVAVAHEDWKQKELKVLRRTKLEELIFAVHDSAHWLEKRREWWWTDNDVTEHDPSYKVMALAALYFPELKQVQTYHAVHLELSNFIVESKRKLFEANAAAKAKQDASLASAAWKLVNEAYSVSYPKLLQAIKAVDAEIATLMQQELA